MGEMMEKLKRIVEDWPRLSLAEVRRYAKREARSSRKPHVVIHNPDYDTYFHDTRENYDAGNACGPGCYVVEDVAP